MSDFLEYVLWELKNSLGLVILAGAVAACVLWVAWFIHKRKHKGEKYPWGRALLWLVFVGYLSMVIYATILRHSGGYRDWNLHLFRAWREAWNNFSAKNWANVLLNIAMFCPLGFLLPLLSERMRKWYLAIPTGFVVSTAIELLQLAISRGICDVDDLFANTLGAAIGYFAVMFCVFLFAQKRKRMKPALIYGCLLLLPVAAIGSIFIAYEIKEYGNLPMAAAYTNNTKDVQWMLDCDFPEAENTVTVYQTQTMSCEDCDALAEEFAKISGQEVEIVSYYQEMAYYNLTGSIFKVYYYDGKYEYGKYDHNTAEWPVADRDTVEAALAHYPVEIPAAAVFSAEEEGWYSFTCDRYIDGAVMIDGVIRCRYGADARISQIENHMVWYRFYKDVAIISPEEAYQRMCCGKFYDGGYFEYKGPLEVNVLSCTLDYEIDTKGFYRPVYYFEVASTDGNYQDRIMIPAMK